MSVLEAHDIRFRYESRVVLAHVSLVINQGEVVSLLGPNGSGKTTLLKILLGLKQPESGRVLLEGVPIANMSPRVLARKIGYVPQLHQIFFPYGVLDVVLMGRVGHQSFFSSYSRKDRDIAMRALERLSIPHLKDRPYTKISGGERQLVLIARALAQEANILILDEPVIGLDYGNQLRFLQQVRRLSAEGCTIIMSTHFPDHALLVSHRVYLLKDGSMLDEGTPKRAMTPENLHRLYRVKVQIVRGPHDALLCVPLLESGQDDSESAGGIETSIAAEK